MTSGTSQARKPLDPVVMMMVALATAIFLTWVIPSGLYTRLPDGSAVAGTFHAIPKVRGGAALLPHVSTDKLAYAASPVSLVTALPLGMAKGAALIVMLLFLGGMFGVLRATGALEQAIEFLVAMTRGHVGLTVPVLMVIISAGGSFLGLISEYLLVIPIVLALSQRLGREAMFGFAIVTVAAKIGYIGSVTNPVILMVAQPLAGVPAFSGAWVRLAVWLLFMAVGIGFVLRGAAAGGQAPAATGGTLSGRHGTIILLLVAAVVLVVYASTQWHWREAQLGAFYTALGIGLGVTAGMSPRTIARHFVEGMKAMLLAAFLVGMAGAVEVVLTEGRILDAIVQGLASLSSGLPRVLIAEALMAVEMVLTLVIPSGSAKAAVSIPILSPMAHLAGISGQTTVLAFLLGNGLVNMISPTSGMLLAYLATAEISFGTWFKYVAPLFLILFVLAVAIVAVAASSGY